MKKFALSVALAVSILILPSASHAYLLDGVQQFNGHYYKIFDYGMTWDDAKKFCENLGGHLVTITSQDEQNFVKNIVSYGERNSYWLGGKKNNNGQWYWITDESFYYTHFGIGEPNNYLGKENSLMMYKNSNPITKSNLGEWNDLKWDGTCNNEPFFGSKNFGLICEWDYPNSLKVRY